MKSSSSSRRVRLSVGLLLAALGATVAAAGCQLIAGLSGNYALEPEGGPGDDGGTSSSTGTGTGTSSGCASAQPPAPPTTTNSGGSISFVTAVRTVDLGDMGDTPGYDLDHVCTCIDDGGPSCVSPKSHCDAPGGIDNAAAQFVMLLNLASSGVNFRSTTLDMTADQGKWTLLIQVENYNGEPDDLGVNVNIYPSAGLGSTPKWDGTDAWPVDPSSLGDGGIGDPVYTSLGAYVSGGVLVAGLPSVAIVFQGGTTFPVTLVGGVLTGTLVKTGDSWKITNGVVAGRWPTQEVFAALSALNANGMPLCTDNPLFPEAKTAICQGADILANASDPPTLPCDSISMGFGFTADPAQIGGIGPTPVLDGGCPAATDPANTMCN